MNAVMLFVRIFLTMIVWLYTSLVVLDVLDVEDYITCGFVGGVVAMIGFLNSSEMAVRAPIIRELAEKYPDIIKPVCETENQCRKRNIGKKVLAVEHPNAKFIALCEDDDNWTGPQNSKSKWISSSHISITL